MPKLQDPAICTPERCRAVSALHWLGVVQILFAVGHTVFQTVITLMDNDLPRFIYQEFIFILMVALIPAVLGASSVSEAVYVCRWHREGTRVGNPSLIGSLFYFFICWVIFLHDLLGPASLSEPSPLQHYFFGAYLCVGSVLAILAAVPCEGLRAKEASRKNQA